MTASMREAEPEDATPTTPLAILAAWRVAERRYALATPGTDDAAALHAEMRRLMDAYEWRVRGSVPEPFRRIHPSRGW
jgi:hypothetical protein